jgi:hypothetical protein
LPSPARFVLEEKIALNVHAIDLRPPERIVVAVAVALTKARSTTGVAREVSTISSQGHGINRPHNPLRRHML